MTKRTLAICCAILILILMATPFGVRMVFFSDVSEEVLESGSQFRSFFGTLSAEHESMMPVSSFHDPTVVRTVTTIAFHYSYFSTMPIGYANFYPLITALMTFIALIMLLIGLKRDTRRMVGICAIGCVLASALSWIMFSAFSAVGLVIMALHIVICILQIERKSDKIVTTPESELWKMK